MIKLTGYPSLQVGLDFLKRFIVEREENGERTVIFCEDRLTLLVEQAVCAALGGSFLTTVTTFARYLSGKGKTLSKQGSVMVVGKLLYENAEKLKCFSSRAQAKKGAAAVYEMISQLAASKVTPQMLKEGECENGLLKDKLSDLSLLYEAYSDYLLTMGYLDENTYLSLLPQAIEGDERLHSSNVVFFGFTSLTAQACDGVYAAMSVAKNVLGLLPCGSGALYSKQAITAFKRTASQFEDVKMNQLKKPAQSLTSADVLRELLYVPEVFKEGTRRHGGDIKIRQCRDEQEELMRVAARIRRHVEEGGRYSDAAVFMRNVQDYALTVEKVFSSLEIPYYSDLKKPLSAHPFAYFLFSLLKVVHGGQTEDVQAVASSPYFGDGGEYRNYLAKYASYRGGYKKEIKSGAQSKEYHFDHLCQMRERMLSAVEPFVKKGTARVFCTGVREVYARFDVAETTKRLAESGQDKLQKEYLARMDKELENILQETECWLGDTPMSVAEFSDLLKSGLQACELSILPLQKDEVFVGDLVQSRVGDTPLVFVVGMDDNVPGYGEDTALLSDADLKKLDEVKICVEPSIAEVNARTKENVCLNLCSFTEKLYLSFSTKADNAPCEILRYIERIFDNTADGEDLFVYEVGTPKSALERFLRLRECCSEKDVQRSGQLYAALKGVGQEEIDKILQKAVPSTYIGEGEKLFFSPTGVSPTLMEKYNSCPYKCFCERGLKLKEREETAVLVTDTGTFMHAVLEATAKECTSFTDEKQCYAFAESKAREQLHSPVFEPLSDTASGQYTGQRLVAECALVAVEMYKQIKYSCFQVAHTEYDCRLKDEGIFGKIDRVDESDDYVRIIDYKTGRTDTKVPSYYAGVKLQLPLYMSSVSEGKIPAGMYYFPAVINYTKEGESPFRLQGFTNKDKEAIRRQDNTLTEEGKKSEFIDASLDGGRSDSLMGEEDFKKFISYSVLCAKSSMREMKQGFIAPSPYEDSCAYCKNKGMCAVYGEKTDRKKYSVKCATIVDVVARANGEDKEEKQ